jgi:hypothetical protein
MKIKDDAIIMVKIPHQKQVEVYTFESDDEIIMHAIKSSDAFGYETYTKEQAIEVWGDEIPDELMSVFKTSDVAVAVSDGDPSLQDCFEWAYFSQEDAPSEIEAAKEFISSDLYQCEFLNFKSAVNFKKEYSGHQASEVRSLINESIERIERDLTFSPSNKM